MVKSASNFDGRNGIDCHKLNWSLFHTTNALQKWNRELFGFAQLRINLLEEELKLLQFGEEGYSNSKRIIQDQLRVQKGKLESIY